MAILHYGQGTHDGFRRRLDCPHDGFRRGRCGLHPNFQSPLHREYRRYRPGLSRDVPDQRIPGHLVSRVDGAHAAPADGSAFGGGNVHARWHTQAGDGHYSRVTPGRTILDLRCWRDLILEGPSRKRDGLSTAPAPDVTMIRVPGEVPCTRLG